MNNLTVEMVEDFLLEFLDITQQKFSLEGFPLDSKSKWLDFKQRNLNFPIKKQHISSKSQIESNIKPHFINKEIDTFSSVNFTNEFKVLLKNVNDNTRFYENLAFKEDNSKRKIDGLGLNIMEYYSKKD